MKSIKSQTAHTKRFVGVGCFVLSLALIFIFVYNKSAASQPALPTLAEKPQKSTPQIIYGIPVRLKIPKIKVDAAIDAMGRKQNGDMEAPKGGIDVGWYKVGARPGNNGTAVMAGHYGQWANGDGSVFDDLNKLQKGDNVYVEDEHGLTATFVVRESKMYQSGQDAPSVFDYASDGKAYLNLITCQGDWNESQKSYSDRLVVFTDKTDK